MNVDRPPSSGPSDDNEEGFHDYTIASALEKFIASIENALRHIVSKRLHESAEPVRLAIAHKLPFRSETYSLRLRVPLPSQGWELEDQAHKLHEWFLHGLPCLELAPNSHSGRVLDAEEVHTLLSAGASALSHLALPWPLLLPVHDALRDAYRGVALRSCGTVSRFDTDSVHGSWLPWQLTAPSALLSLFADRLRYHAPGAAARCSRMSHLVAHAHHDRHRVEPSTRNLAFNHDAAAAAAAAAGDDDDRFASSCVETNVSGLQQSSQTESTFIVHSTRRCYQLPHRSNSPAGGFSAAMGDTIGPITSAGSAAITREGSSEFELVIDTWDESATWRPWAAEDDPVGGLEVDALWRRRLPSHVEALAAEEQAVVDADPAVGDASTADAWRIAAVPVGYEPDTGRRGLLLLQAVDQRRRFLKLQSVRKISEAGRWALHPRARSDGGAVYDDALADVVNELSGDVLPGAATSFYAMLRAAVDAAAPVSEARDMGDLASVEWWAMGAGRVPELPAAHIIQDIIRDLFLAPVLPGMADFEEAFIDQPTVDALSLPPVGKAAPLGALATRLALHCLRLGSPRATASLWSRFLREIRFSHWDLDIPLPRMKLETTTASQNFVGTTRECDAGLHAGQHSRDTASATSTQSSSPGDGDGVGDNPPAIDVSHSLLHQKLQLLDLCIEAQKQQKQHRTVEQERRAAPELARPSSSLSSVSPSPSPSTTTTANSDEYFSAGTSACSSKKEQAEDHEEPDANGDDDDAKGPATRAAAAGRGRDSAGVDAQLSMALGNNRPIEPEGVIERLDICLIDFPEQGVNVPATQNPPPYTEDALMELATASAAVAASQPKSEEDAGDSADAAASNRYWQRTHGALLLSDMQAFKAANPGCKFEDFVRWHSPKDWVQCYETEEPKCHTTTPTPPHRNNEDSFGGWGLSLRMSAPGNAWMNLWDASKPIPISRQRPLFQASLEGERALHYLETLSPAALHAEMISLAFSGALTLLERAPAASLPAVKVEVQALRAMARSMLSRAGGHDLYEMQSPPVSSAAATTDVESSGPASVLRFENAAAGPTAIPAGLSVDDMRVLLRAFGCVEQTVAAAQSLVQRLGGPTPGCSWYRAHADEVGNKKAGSDRKMRAERLANVLIDAALSSSHSSKDGGGTTMVDLLGKEEFDYIAAVVGESDRGWAREPFCSEWCVEVFEAQQQRPVENATSSISRSAGQPLHRMFARALPAELRMATIVTDEI